MKFSIYDFTKGSMKKIILEEFSLTATENTFNLSDKDGKVIIDEKEKQVKVFVDSIQEQGTPIGKLSANRVGLIGVNIKIKKDEIHFDIDTVEGRMYL